MESQEDKDEVVKTYRAWVERDLQKIDRTVSKNKVLTLLGVPTLEKRRILEKSTSTEDLSKSPPPLRSSNTGRLASRSFVDLKKFESFTKDVVRDMMQEKTGVPLSKSSSSSPCFSG